MQYGFRKKSSYGTKNYHTPQPSATVQTMLSDGLVRIHEANPEMTIVMTAGNHDSGTKHEIFQTPWKALKVYAIGQLEKENLDEHIIELPGKGYIIAIPYANERNIPEGFGTLSGEPLQNAINTLRSLHTKSGRHVGIISHVEELQERIPIQIQVIQEGNNSSSKVKIIPEVPRIETT